MKYISKKIIFTLLTTTSLSLATSDPTQAGKLTLYIEPEDGYEIEHTPNRVTIKQKTTQESAQINLIPTEGTPNYDQIISILKKIKGIKDVALREPSPDEKCAKRIQNFNRAQEADQNLSSKINRLRKTSSALQKYLKQGSTLAKDNLPILHYTLGVALIESLDEKSPISNQVILLKEALQLVTESAKSKLPEAVRDLPKVQHSLAAALTNSIEGLEISKQIPLLREALQLITESAKSKLPEAMTDLPKIQYNLASTLSETINEALPLSPQMNLFREAVQLLTESAKLGDPDAANDLPMAKYNLGMALSESIEEQTPLPTQVILLKEARTFLREALELLTKNKKSGDPDTIKDLALVQYNLGVILWDLADISTPSEQVSLLAEAYDLLTKSKDLGDQDALEELPDLLDALTIANSEAMKSKLK